MSASVCKVCSQNHSAASCSELYRDTGEGFSHENGATGRQDPSDDEEDKADALVLKHRIRQPILTTQPVQSYTKHFHFPVLLNNISTRIPNFKSKAQRIRARSINGARRLVVARALRK
jgi:hypothetical protein